MKMFADEDELTVEDEDDRCLFCGLPRAVCERQLTFPSFAELLVDWAWMLR